MDDVKKLTAELRWFFDRPLPFAENLAGLPIGEPTERQDYYLLDSGERRGVKWREGNLEIKQQVGEAEVCEADYLTGYLERWTKWSFALADQEAFGADDHWLEVTKRRQLVSFSYDPPTHRVSLTSDSESKHRCELEYTHLTVAKDSYYTLGLEASGEPASLRACLVQTVAYLSEHTSLNGWGLRRTSSSNYARWMHHHFSYNIR